MSKLLERKLNLIREIIDFSEFEFIKLEEVINKKTYKKELEEFNYEGFLNGDIETKVKGNGERVSSEKIEYFIQEINKIVKSPSDDHNVNYDHFKIWDTNKNKKLGLYYYFIDTYDLAMLENTNLTKRQVFDLIKLSEAYNVRFWVDSFNNRHGL